MIRKGIIWFLVLAFLNFIIVPDFVYAEMSVSGDFGPSGGESAICYWWSNSIRVNYCWNSCISQTFKISN